MTDYFTFEDKYPGPLEPDTLLPSQFFGAIRQKARLDGERRLMAAVLEDGLHCFQKHVHATDQKARRLFLEAEGWITATDQSWFFSFVNVCETLGLDPDYVREGLLKWKNSELHRRDLRHHFQGENEASEDTSAAHVGDENVEQDALRKASGA